MAHFIELDCFGFLRAGEPCRILLNLDDVSHFIETSDKSTAIIRRSGVPQSSGINTDFISVPHGYDQLLEIIEARKRR